MPTPGTIIFNMTVKMDPSISEDLISWLIEEHLPEMVSTGFFTDFQLIKLLDIDESDGPTYAIQLYAKTREDFYRYEKEVMVEHNKKMFSQWGEQYVIFHTLMEVVK